MNELTGEKAIYLFLRPLVPEGKQGVMIPRNSEDNREQSIQQHCVQRRLPWVRMAGSYMHNGLYSGLHFWKHFLHLKQFPCVLNKVAETRIQSVGLTTLNSSQVPLLPLTLITFSSLIVTYKCIFRYKYNLLGPFCVAPVYVFSADH